MPHLPGIRLIGAAESALLSAPITCQVPDVDISAGKGLLGPVCVLIPPVTPPLSPHVYFLDDLAFEHGS